MAQPTPFSNVPTTNDIASQRKLAMALMQNGTDASPVGHWTQALARTLQGGLGGYQASKASEGEKSRQDALAQALSGSGTFGGLSDGDRAIMTQNPEIMQSVVSKGLGNKMDPSAGLNRQIAEAKLKNLQAGGEKPSSVREWEYFNRLSPEDQQKWLINKRAEKYLDTGVGFVRPDPLNPTAPPKPVVTKDIAGRETEEKIGQARGEFIAAYPRSAAAIESLNAKKDIVLGEIAEARKLIGGSSTGLAGSVLKNVPMTNAYALKERVKTILANVGFDELSNMRAESPTGGALGAIAVQELTYLQAVRGSLEQAQSESDFKRILGQLENFQKGAVERRQKALDMSIKQFGLSPRPGGTVGMNPAPVLDKMQGRLPQTDQQPIPRVASDADFDALPSGAVFLDPNGNKRTKP